jgi:hypothetical protein
MSGVTKWITALLSAPEPQSAGWTKAERAEWIETATNVGLDYVKQQRDEVWTIRGRAVTFVAFSTAATAFLVGAGLKETERDFLFYLVAGVGTALFLVTVWFLLRVIRPKVEFRTVLESDVLLRWMDGNEPPKDLEHARLRLAREVIPSMVADNEASLKVVRLSYWILLIFGFATVAVWTVLVWVFI